MSTKTKVWTEELIQNELKRLDDLVYRKKGIILEGATIPIKFNNIKSWLGYFDCSKLDFEFGFSRFYFDDDQFPESSAFDVIRHEYAHYYAYAVFGSKGHDKYWHAACSVVGASTTRVHTKEFDDRKKRIEEKENRIYNNLLDLGTKIMHKKYGNGVICVIKKYRDLAVETVLFDSGFIKKLDESWIIENCQIIDSE